MAVRAELLVGEEMGGISSGETYMHAPCSSAYFDHGCYRHLPATRKTAGRDKHPSVNILKNWHSDTVITHKRTITEGPDSNFANSKHGIHFYAHTDQLAGRNDIYKTVALDILY